MVDWHRTTSNPRSQNTSDLPFTSSTAPCTELRPGADPARRAGHPAHDPVIGQAYRRHHGARRVPSSSADQCPNRSQRVKGAYGVARDRFATLDPPTAHQGFSAYEEDGGG